jgi:hypothetical protein
LAILLCCLGCIGITGNCCWSFFFRNKPRLYEILAFAGILVGIWLLYFYIRPVQTELMGEAAEVQAMIGQGYAGIARIPITLLCCCIALKPTIDALEEEFAGRLDHPAHRRSGTSWHAMAPVYGFQYTPTFVFFD